MVIKIIKKGKELLSQELNEISSVKKGTSSVKNKTSVKKGTSSVKYETYSVRKKDLFCQE